MKRVTVDAAWFVHVMPTPFWKALSFIVYYPDQARAALRRVWRRLSARPDSSRHGNPLPGQPTRSWRERLLPPIHGVSRTHALEFRDFHPDSWQRLFEAHGYSCVRVLPLATYSPSEVPLVPPNRLMARLGFPSSIAYFLRRHPALCARRSG
jgi:hypothetical protein